MNVISFQELERSLGYTFTNIKLITEALTHRSHHHEFRDSSHNERLEFLGDAVLDLCCTELLMNASPDMTEGQLSKLRSTLVSEKSLAKAGLRLNLGSIIRLGRGEEKSGGRSRDSLLADTLEAVIGVIYLESGIEVTRRVIARILELDNSETLLESYRELLSSDYKSMLQEACQKLGYGTPLYVCKKVTGPDHQKEFTMALKIQGFEVVEASCVTKKNATQKAAHKLLALLDFETFRLKSFLEDKGFCKSKSVEKEEISL
jgi:ribonuclease-3